MSLFTIGRLRQSLILSNQSTSHLSYPVSPGNIYNRNWGLVPSILRTSQRVPNPDWNQVHKAPKTTHCRAKTGLAHVFFHHALSKCHCLFRFLFTRSCGCLAARRSRDRFRTKRGDPPAMIMSFLMDFILSSPAKL